MIKFKLDNRFLLLTKNISVLMISLTLPTHTKLDINSHTFTLHLPRPPGPHQIL